MDRKWSIQAVLSLDRSNSEGFLPYFREKLVISSQYLYNSMRISLAKLLIASVVLMLALASAQQCQKGQIKIDSKCIDCKTLENVRIDDVESWSEGDRCPCSPGHAWSKALLRCQAYRPSGRSILSYSAEEGTAEKSEGQVSRLLQSGCSSVQGFITSGTSCLNCRLIPFTQGIAYTSTACACVSSFGWATDRCFCYYKNYIDYAAKTCNPCTTAITDTVTFAICQNCLFPFAYSSFGCVLCATLPNNGGDTACCATGFKFSYSAGICVCDRSQGYAVDPNGICSKCATADTNCVSCIRNYINDGFSCVYGGNIPNFNLVSNACIAGTVYKTAPLTNKRVSCACATSLGYYQDGDTCKSCTTQPPDGIPTTVCKACPAAQDFYSGPVQCIYCPGVAYTQAGKATANGCGCQANYYWNSLTDRCECDFTLGFVGGAIDTCLICSEIANTAATINADGCSCQSGYIWNSEIYECECNAASPSVYTSGPLCIDCSQIIGSTGVANKGDLSCACINGYTWSFAKSECVCDPLQNFVVFPNGFCTDCSLVAKASGLGYAGGCVCQDTLIWDPATATCGCPSGFAVVGTTCKSCQAIVDSDVNIILQKCLSCDVEQFKQQDGACFLCSGQRGGSCDCSGTGQVWKGLLGGCVCDMASDYMATVNSDGISFTCESCDYYWVSNDKCACGFGQYIYSSTYGICTNAVDDPNIQTTTNDELFTCKPGYIWSEKTFPFKCIPGAMLGVAYIAHLTTDFTYPLCTTLAANGLQEECEICDKSSGFVLIAGINSCLYCQAVDGATGEAIPSGCLCEDGKEWNPITLSCVSSSCDAGKIYDPLTSSCICDPVKSAAIDEDTCFACQGASNSLGYADAQTSCACEPEYLWKAVSPYGCVSDTSCDADTSVWEGGVCYVCPTVDDDDNAGGKIGDVCTCQNDYIWVTKGTTSSCVCDSATSVVLPDSKCFVCSTISGAKVDGKGGCLCPNNHVWEAESKDCLCDSTVGAIKSGDNCFQCLDTIDKNFAGTVTDSKCDCLNGFTFEEGATVGGKCVCKSPSLVLPSGKCSSCPSNDNTTGSVGVRGDCECNNNYIWSSSDLNCLCEPQQSAIITTSRSCFKCVTSNDPNFEGTVTDGACDCKTGWTFNATTTGGNCICSGDFYIEGSDCKACPSTSPATGKSDGDNGCACDNNYIWDPTRDDCSCDSDVLAFVLPSEDCFQCSPSVNINFDGSLTVNTEDEPNGCGCTHGWAPGVDTNGLPTCVCPDYVSSLGVCYQCTASDLLTGEYNETTQGCICKNGFQWDPLDLVCKCDLATSLLVSASSCFKCGTKDTYTSTKKNARECRCQQSNLKWNADFFMCDCGAKKALVEIGNSFTCVDCRASIFAVGKADPHTCICNSELLAWNPLTKMCDCGENKVFYNSACVTCDADVYAISRHTTKPNECLCQATGFAWNKDLGFCACTSASSVIFVTAGVPSCKPCGAATRSVSGTKASPFSCKCPTGSVWLPNVGCACTGENAVAVVRGSTTTCVACTPELYSSGPTANQSSCACLGTLTWIITPNTATCGCKVGAISILNGEYFCSPCTAANFAKNPLVKVNECTCVANTIKWKSEGYCGCDSPESQVVVGTGAATACLTCNSAINANGKTTPDAKVCKCVSDALTFNTNICDCGKDKAFILEGLATYTCINCKNATIFLKAKKSASECECTSTALKWDPSLGICKCEDATKIIQGTGKSTKCSSCVGQYIKVPNSPKTCSCLGTGLVFSLTATSMVCKCPQNNFINSQFTCTLCTTPSPPTAYECKCPTNSFWHIASEACKSCATIENSNSQSSSFLACKCKTGFTWDVMTQTCITDCGSSCVMNCAGLLHAEGEAFIPQQRSTKTLPGIITVIQNALKATTTNYLRIQRYECACATGYLWDYIRLRCYDQLIFALLA